MFLFYESLQKHQLFIPSSILLFHKLLFMCIYVYMYECVRVHMGRQSVILAEFCLFVHLRFRGCLTLASCVYVHTRI